MESLCVENKSSPFQPWVSSLSIVFVHRWLWLNGDGQYPHPPRRRQEEGVLTCPYTTSSSAGARCAATRRVRTRYVWSVNLLFGEVKDGDTRRGGSFRSPCALTSGFDCRHSLPLLTARSFHRRLKFEKITRFCWAIYEQNNINIFTVIWYIMSQT